MKVFRRRRLLALAVIVLWALGIAAVVWALWLLNSVLILVY